jgi:hypothetical protein
MGAGCRADHGHRALFRDATVSALVWKNIFMDPVNGFVCASVARLSGPNLLQWLSDVPITSLIMIVSWQWLPFATLILLTAIQSLDGEQLEAAEMDGAGPVARFFHIILPHLARAITLCLDPNDLFAVYFCRNLCDHGRGLRHADADLSDLPTGVGKPECGSGVCGRGLCHHSCKYCCDLLDAHRWQEFGRVGETIYGPSSHKQTESSSILWLPGRWAFDLLPDLMDDPDCLSKPRRKRSMTRLYSCSLTGR